MIWGVVQFPGSCDERDALQACRRAGEARLLWHGDRELGDEALTPDSSRFWPADGYAPGRSQPSFDKQFVRDWSDESGWDHSPPGPEIPPDVVEQTRGKYLEAYERITGLSL